MHSEDWSKRLIVHHTSHKRAISIILRYTLDIFRFAN